MKTFNTKHRFFKMVSLVMVLTVLASCDFEFDLPEAGSLPDETPPEANFAASQSAEDWMRFDFANLSVSATTYAWTFGDGNTSTDLDATNVFPAEGTYTVTLTVSDNLGATNTFSMDVPVIEPEEPEAIVPVILEASFEDGMLDGGSGDGRDSWRNSFGGVIQITGSPVHDGSQASKYPSAGDRVAYQEMECSPNTDYILTYYYTLKTNNPGSITVNVLGGGITDLSEVAGASLASHEGTDQTSSSTYVRVDLPFNTGANATMAILVTNQGEEARLDNFSIKVAE